MDKKMKREKAGVKSSAVIGSMGKKTIVKKLVNFDIDYEDVFRDISDGILIHKNGIVVDANNSFLKLFGYKLGEIKGTDSFKNMVDPSSVDMVKKKIAEKYENSYEIYGRKKNGQKFPMEINARDFEINGVNLRMVSCRDITKIKKNEAIIKKQALEFRQIFENFQDLYYRTDLNGVIISVSPSVKTLTGYNQNEILGKKSSQIYFNPRDRDIFVKKIMTKGEVRNFRTKLVNRKGKPVDVSITSHLIFNEEKKPIGIEGIIRDITKELKTEGEINLKLKELEKLNNLMIGRELKMVELKQKINELEKNKNS